MQKKSLLVALFCGALCLTGCLKNEESASVAQVRIAKANELNSIADLNKAKAAAEAVYAEAELTLAKAEAELKKADAALVNAQAETEKVRAELLKVQVEFATVKVDEEKIELAKKKAELEIALANAEAAKAAAKWAEQYWINQLAQLAADAEVAAVKNAQALIEAENEILKLEGERADSAKVYAALYFEALDSVAVLQAKEIAVKVAKVLAEREAYEVRDAIHELIDENNAEIAENNTKIEALKKYQTVSPEEAEAQLAEAYDALTVAYNAYMAALDAQKDAEDAQEDAENKTSDFWKNSSWSTVKNALRDAGVSLSSDNSYPVKVGEVTVSVKAQGITVQTEDGPVFKPLFSDEGKKRSFSRYPDIDVIAKDESDHIDIWTSTVAPATLYYDNIQEAMDTVLAQQQRFADFGVAMVEWWGDFMIEWNKNTIADLKSKNELQAKYVAARKDTVEKYEKAYLAALEAQETYETKKAEAWQAFQEYMLLKTDVSRQFFVDQYMADTAYAKAYADSVDAALALAGAKAGLPGLKDAVEEAFQAAAKAEGVLDSLKKRRDTATETDAYKKYAKLTDAEKRWNPEFAKAVADGDTPTFAGYANEPATTSPYTLNYEYFDIAAHIEYPNTRWYIKEHPEIKAGTAQDSLYSAQFNVDLAAILLYEANVDSVRNHKPANYGTIVSNYNTRLQVLGQTATTDGIKKKAASAESDYKAAKQAYDTEIGTKIAKAEEAWTYGLNIFDYVTYPTEARPTQEYTYTKYNTEKKEWEKDVYGKVPGTAQVALFDAVKKVADAIADAEVKDPGNKIKKDWTTGETYFKADAAAKTAWTNYVKKSKELMQKLGADLSKVTDENVREFIKENIGEYIDEEANKLYQAFLDVKNEADKDALTNLWTVYLGVNPDGIDRWEKHPGTNNSNFNNAEFGWLRSSYNVDYEATYLNFQGEEEPIAWILYPWQQNQFTHSYKYQIEALTKANEEDIPQGITNAKTGAENYIKGVQDNIDDALAVVNSFKAHEATYKAWVTERVAAEEAVIDAKKVSFDAKQDYLEAKAEYQAAYAAANEGVWIYDPANLEKGKHNKDGFVKVTISRKIEKLEKKNEELEEQNEEYRQALSDGKKALSILNQILDETLEQIQEAIEIWTAIADKYKALMNAYLNIVEEQAAVVEEGDEE